MIRPKLFTTNRISENKVEIDMVINPDLFYFDGHFAVRKVLPGVVQLGWAQEFSEEFFKIKSAGETPVVKFTAPIIPQDRVKLTLEYLPDKKRVSFAYVITSQNNAKASAGKLITK